MEETDFVLSDVHIGSSIDKEAPERIIYHSSSDFHEIKVGISRFEFKLPSNIMNENAAASAMRAQEHLIYDEDGDIEVPRNIGEVDVITIEHSLGSPLSLVGLQVWNGALFLSDYLLNVHEQLSGKMVLELGAGSGISSIVSSKFAKLTICTDTKDEILNLCQKNILQNASKNRIIVKDLDWCKANPFEITSNNEWSWTKEDLTILQQIDFIIAADVIYSDNLTDAFFKLLQPLLQSEKLVTVILSLEKRLNFSLEDLDVCCPAYKHFREWIIKLERNQPHVQVFQIEDNFDQYFKYQRTKYLEIWKFVNTTSTS